MSLLAPKMDLLWVFYRRLGIMLKTYFRFGFTMVSWWRQPAHPLPDEVLSLSPTTTSASAEGWILTYPPRPSRSQPTVAIHGTRHCHNSPPAITVPQARDLSRHRPHCHQHRQSTTTVTDHSLAGWRGPRFHHAGKDFSPIPDLFGLLRY